MYCLPLEQYWQLLPLIELVLYFPSIQSIQSGPFTCWPALHCASTMDMVRNKIKTMMGTNEFLNIFLDRLPLMIFITTDPEIRLIRWWWVEIFFFWPVLIASRLVGWIESVDWIVFSLTDFYEPKVIKVFWLNSFVVDLWISDSVDQHSSLYLLHDFKEVEEIVFFKFF